MTAITESWNHYWYSSQTSEDQIKRFQAINSFLIPNPGVAVVDLVNLVIDYEGEDRIFIEMSRIFNAMKWNLESLCIQSKNFFNIYKINISKLSINIGDEAVVLKVMAVLPRFLHLKTLDVKIEKEMDAAKFRSFNAFLIERRIFIGSLCINKYKSNQSLQQLLTVFQPALQNLTDLEFTNCQLDDQTLSEVVSSIPSVRTLSLVNNHKSITNRSFDTICSSGITGLHFRQTVFDIADSQYLRISSIRRLTLQPDSTLDGPHRLSKIAPLRCLARMPQLQFLDITNLPIAVDNFADLDSFASLGSLQSLSFGGFRIYSNYSTQEDSRLLETYISHFAQQVIAKITPIEWIPPKPPTPDYKGYESQCGD